MWEFDYASGFVGFLCGVMVAFLLFAIIASLVSVNKLDSVEDIESTEIVYLVTVDGVTFTCKDKPESTDNGILLVNCQELYGDETTIKNFRTFSYVIQ